MNKPLAIKQPKCTKVLLEDGTSDADHKFLDIEPTMKNITHDGRRYFRTKSFAQDPSDGKWGLMYLWEGWFGWRYAQIMAEEAANETEKDRR